MGLIKIFVDKNYGYNFFKLLESKQEKQSQQIPKLIKAIAVNTISVKLNNTKRIIQCKI